MKEDCYFLKRRPRGRPRITEKTILRLDHKDLSWWPRYSERLDSLKDDILAWHFQLCVRRECARWWKISSRPEPPLRERFLERKNPTRVSDAADPFERRRIYDDARKMLRTFCSLIKRNPIVTLENIEEEGLNHHRVGELSYFFDGALRLEAEPLVRPTTVGDQLLDGMLLMSGIYDKHWPISKRRKGIKPTEKDRDRMIRQAWRNPIGDYVNFVDRQRFTARTGIHPAKVSAAIGSCLWDRLGEHPKSPKLGALREYRVLKYIDLAMLEAVEGLDIVPSLKAEMLFPGQRDRKRLLGTTTHDNAVPLLDEGSLQSRWIEADAIDAVVEIWGGNGGCRDGRFVVSRDEADIFPDPPRKK